MNPTRAIECFSPPIGIRWSLLSSSDTELWSALFRQTVRGEGAVRRDGVGAREAQLVLLPDGERPAEPHPPGAEGHREGRAPRHWRHGERKQATLPVTDSSGVRKRKRVVSQSL